MILAQASGSTKLSVYMRTKYRNFLAAWARVVSPFRLIVIVVGKIISHRNYVTLLFEKN